MGMDSVFYGNGVNSFVHGKIFECVGVENENQFSRGLDFTQEFFHNAEKTIEIKRFF